MDILTLSLAKSYTDKQNKCVKTMFYEGTPTKLDLTAYSMGTMYLVSTENILSLAKGQDVYYEYTANGNSVKGVMDSLTISGGNVVMCTDGQNTAMSYQAGLGGLGFACVIDGTSVGKDLGDIMLKLWTEYNPNRNYIVPVGDDGTIPNINSEEVINSLRTGNVCIKVGAYLYKVVRSVCYDSIIVLDALEVTKAQGSSEYGVQAKHYEFIDGVHQKA